MPGRLASLQLMLVPMERQENQLISLSSFIIVSIIIIIVIIVITIITMTDRKV